ncbi:flavin reductase family protein [Aquimarina sp. ERC-38]|uniref:flavin reductase family protein n=1 Tax=Aquimarina sp. ERC-38 TaxID=2949996 RepID=UPI0022457DD3|nr:flavin reductase [Aquimarina sp. ERC-38]UZO80520.1 flavin reductase family protein [Aquimarina sp. ERC-38]
MKHFSQEELLTAPSRYRANLINSCTGYKSCNLIATQNQKGITNVAIFNSVIHIGSNPPMLGFILRPLSVPRHTYANFKENEYFTVNQVPHNQIEKAHQTAAKYKEGASEFKATGLKEEYLNNFKAPYVSSSPIKLGCRYLNECVIKENNTLLIIGGIEELYIDETIITKDGWVDLTQAETAACIGLDGYALPELLARFSYAKPEEPVQKI